MRLQFFGFGYLIFVCGLFLVGAGYFASHQSIWVDETTQLTGLALPSSERLRWLVGASDVELGVPADRMPPLSYWLGAGWASVFGLSEFSMRWFGIIATLAAAPALYLAGRIRGGDAGGAFAVAVVLLAPGTMVMAGEIRAYPLFLSLSAWSVWAFLRCLDPEMGDKNARVFTLSALIVLSTYTHFFGIVLAGTLFAALLVARLASGQGMARVMRYGLASFVAVLGIAPFVLAAVAKSSGSNAAADDPISTVAMNTVRLALRLVVHASHFVYSVNLIAVIIALLVIVLITVLSVFFLRNVKNHSLQTVMLALPIVIAGLALPVLDLFIDGFEVLAPHYNLWLVPLVAVFMAGAFASWPGCQWHAQVVRIAGLVAIIGHVFADIVLLAHASLYSHGPGEWLFEAWDATPRHAVVHDARGAWGHGYFPLYYLSGGEAAQFIQSPDGSLSRISPRGLEVVPDDREYLSAFEGVLTVRIENLPSMELARIATGREPCSAPAPLGFDNAELDYFCAFAAASLARRTTTER